MIEIKDKKMCCGCEACINACPKNCISFLEDERGFSYPSVNKNECINCGLCKNVCPVLNPNKPRNPIEKCAFKNPNERERMNSSSGGLFILLAKQIIKENGVVFGVSFNDNWMPVHKPAETIEDVYPFMGSKYVQSRIGDSFKNAKCILESGRKVLFSGTPCQIAGLRAFLRKDYPNLFTVEVMCHGVPSPMVWREYVNLICQKAVYGQNTVLPDVSKDDMSVITGISFRDKTNGWSKYGFVVYGRSADKEDDYSVPSFNFKIINHRAKEDPYFQAFWCSVDLRPICYECPFKSGKGCSDISIGDFWGMTRYIDNTFNDDKGVSIVYVLSSKGKEIFKQVGGDSIKLDSDVEYNIAFCSSARIKYPVQKFWDLYERYGISVSTRIYKSLKPSLLQIIKSSIKNKLSRILK